jgi:predicted nucleotidyltransferase
MSLSPDIISRIIQCLADFNLYKVILFGSYARGTATEDSDLDLLVILDTDKFAKTFKEKIERRTPISMALLDINRLFAMDIIVYSKGEFNYLKGNGDFFVKEIEDTGVEIYGN